VSSDILILISELELQDEKDRMGDCPLSQALLSQYCSMSEERIVDKFLRKLYEKTVNNRTQNIDREEIGMNDRIH
jgi:hypothetical protein